MKACVRSRCVAPLILKVGTTCRYAFNFMSHIAFAGKTDIKYSQFTACFQKIFCNSPIICGSSESSVGIATRYGLDGPGIEVPVWARFSTHFQTGPGAHPASYAMCTSSFPGVKRPESGVDHPPHLAPRLKKE